MGNVTLYVSDPTASSGRRSSRRSWARSPAGDTHPLRRRRTPAGNVSRRTPPLRAVPVLAGKSLTEAATALGAASFTLGSVTETIEPTVPPGTVVEPAGIRLALASSPIDIVVARGVTAPQTRLALSIAGSSGSP